MKVPKNCAANARLGLAVYGVVGGIMVFFTFGFQFHNWPCAAWGLLSGLVASFSLIIEVVNKVSGWSEKKKWLLLFTVLGCLGMTVGIIAFPVYITYAAVEKHYVMPHGRSFWVVSVWCFLTFKNGLVVFHSSLSYYFQKPPEDKLEEELEVS